MATMRVKVTTFTIDEQTIVESVLGNVEAALRNKIGPHLVYVAKHRAPVSKPKNFNPRDSGFENLRLATEEEIGGESKTLSRLFESTAAQRVGLFEEAFKGGSTKDPKITRFFRGTGDNAGKIPSVLKIRRGTIQGAFRNKSGTLRRSIRLDSVKVQGNKVKLTVRAHAPYAWYVHEGHPRPRPPKPFLRSALANIKDEATDGSTYKG